MTAKNDTVFVWAGSAPDEAPDRLEYTPCRCCGALVPTDRDDAHQRWHKRSAAAGRRST